MVDTGMTPADGTPPEVPAAGTTGSYLVALRKDAVGRAASVLNRVAGLQTVSAREFGDAIPRHVENGTAVVFESLGVAVVDAPTDQLRAVGVAAASADEPSIVVSSPERVVHAIGTNMLGFNPAATSSAPPAGRSAEYLLGYQDAVNRLVDSLLGSAGTGAATRAAAAFDESQTTWGLQITNAVNSRFSGRGVKVAVLDTGLDLMHPDLNSRTVVSQSFITGESVQDGHGHGTHCIGTACGSQSPSQLPRYGVAHDADIYAGKVLNNQGSGIDRNILAGIEWAMNAGCDIISMSLGAMVLPGQPFSAAFEFAVQPVLDQGILILAAAGNDSGRPGSVLPVSHPANCPSIMAVAAIDDGQGVASFSNGGVNPDGVVDIAAPGVNVLSSWPQPTLYRRLNGTSMATPHVAGIAALFAEANPKVRGRALGEMLTRTARDIGLPSSAGGVGLVQAP